MVIPIAIGSDTIVDTSKVLNREQEDERSVATDDDSSTAAGLLIKFLMNGISINRDWFKA
ncbi:MAG: hypothetical protein WDN26_17085 [Chitinophagaceae bacterium]